MMRCVHCHREVAEGLYCAACGRRQDPTSRSQARRDRFAAHPDEAVGQLSLVTSIFPQLDHDGVQAFRWALIAGAAVILVFAAVGAIGGATLAAAALVPGLFLLYLYDVRAYRDSPLLVVGVTFGGGALLGAGGRLLEQTLAGPGTTAIPTLAGPLLLWGPLLAATVLAPTIQEVLKPIPALILRGRSEFGQQLDGFVLGMTAGMGFAFGAALVGVLGVIGGLDQRTSLAVWFYPIVTTGLMAPALHGLATAGVTLGLWSGHDERVRGTLVALGVAIAAHVLFSLGTQLLVSNGQPGVVQIAWQAVVVGGLLLFVRAHLHDALLNETHPQAPRTESCWNCGRPGVDGAFCPTCGAALSAVPMRTGPHAATQQPPADEPA